MKKILVSLLILSMAVPVVIAQTIRKTAVAVMDLRGSGLSETDAKFLTERLMIELQRTDVFDVLERDKMDEILKEQGFQQTGACDQTSCLVEAGRLLPVQKMIGGSVGKFGETFSVQIRLINLKTAKVEKTAFKDFHKKMDFLLTEGMAMVAQTMSGAVTVTTEPTQTLPAVEDTPDTGTAGTDSTDWYDMKFIEAADVHGKALARQAKGSYLERGQHYNEALSAYDQAEVLFPTKQDKYSVLMVKQRLLIALGRHKEVIDLSNRLVSLTSKSEDQFRIALEQSDSYVALGNFETAMGPLYSALSLTKDPEQKADIYMKKGRIFIKLKKDDLAIVQLKLAADFTLLPARKYEATLAQIDAATRLKRFNDAIAICDQAVILAPDIEAKASVTYTKIDLLIQAKRFADAIKTCETLTDLYTTSEDKAKIALLKGSLFYKTGKVADARASYQQAFTLYKNSNDKARARIEDGKILMGEKQYRDAGIAFDEAEILATEATTKDVIKNLKKETQSNNH